jgi:predicted XRE-type DNA-binding protein
MNEQRFESVWDALEDTAEEAEHMKLRATLMVALQERVSGWGLSQAKAARRLGITQPRLNDLLRGRIEKFSLDALVGLLKPAGLYLDIDIREVA